MLPVRKEEEKIPVATLINMGLSEEEAKTFQVLQGQRVALCVIKPVIREE